MNKTLILIISMAFLPLALLLLILGINHLSVNDRGRICTKIAVLVNSSLIIALNLLGNSAYAQGEQVMCYDIALIDYTDIPDGFDQSGDWDLLESLMVQYEYQINRGDADEGAADKIRDDMFGALERLNASKTVSRDDAELIKAYIWSRDMYFKTSVCGIKCYMPAELKDPKQLQRNDIINSMDVLRQLYARGDIASDAYHAAIENLEAELKVYTGMEDNALLRQLLLDLADGRTAAD